MRFSSDGGSQLPTSELRLSEAVRRPFIRRRRSSRPLPVSRVRVSDMFWQKLMNVWWMNALAVAGGASPRATWEEARGSNSEWSVGMDDAGDTHASAHTARATSRREERMAKEKLSDQQTARNQGRR